MSAETNNLIEQTFNAVRTLHDVNCSQREKYAANEFFINIQNDTTNCFVVGYQLVHIYKNDIMTIHAGFTLMKNAISCHWQFLGEFQSNFQNITLGLLPFTLLEAKNDLLTNSYCLLVCEVAKRTWPQLWPNFIQDLMNVCVQSDRIDVFLHLLRYLVLEIQSPDSSLGNNRPKIISTEFKKCMPHLLGVLCNHLVTICQYDFSSNVSLASLILATFEELLKISDTKLVLKKITDQTDLNETSSLEPTSDATLTPISILYHFCSSNDENLIIGAIRCLSVIVDKSSRQTTDVRSFVNLLFSRDNLGRLCMGFRQFPPSDLFSSNNIHLEIMNYLKLLLSSANLFVEYCKMQVNDPFICGASKADDIVVITREDFVRIVLDALESKSTIEVFIYAATILQHLHKLFKNRDSVFEYIVDASLRLYQSKLVALAEMEEKYGDKFPCKDYITIGQIRNCIDHAIKIMICDMFSVNIITSAFDCIRRLLANDSAIAVHSQSSLNSSQPTELSVQTDSMPLQMTAVQKAMLYYISSVFRAFFESSHCTMENFSNPQLHPVSSHLVEIILPTLLNYNCSECTIPDLLICIQLIRYSIRFLEYCQDFTLPFVEKVFSILDCVSTKLETDTSQECVSSQNSISSNNDQKSLNAKSEKQKTLEVIERQCAIAFETIFSKFPHMVFPHHLQIICLIVTRMNNRKTALDFSSEAFLFSLFSSCNNLFTEAQLLDVVISLTSPFTPLFHDPHYISLLSDFSSLNQIFEIPSSSLSHNKTSHPEKLVIENFTQILTVVCRIPTGAMQKVRLAAFGQQLLNYSLRVIILLHKWYCSLWCSQNRSLFGNKFFLSLSIFIDSVQFTNPCISSTNSEKLLSNGSDDQSPSLNDVKFDDPSVISHLRNLGDQIFSLLGLLLSQSEVYGTFLDQPNPWLSFYQQLWIPLVEYSPAGRIKTFFCQCLRPIYHTPDIMWITVIGLPLLSQISRDLIRYFTNKLQQNFNNNNPSKQNGGHEIGNQENNNDVEVIDSILLDCLYRELISFLPFVLLNRVHLQNSPLSDSGIGSQITSPKFELENSQEKSENISKSKKQKMVSLELSKFGKIMISHPECRNSIIALIFTILSSPVSQCMVNKLKDLASEIIFEISTNLNLDLPIDQELINHIVCCTFKTLFVATSPRFADTNEFSNAVHILMVLYTNLLKIYPQISSILLESLPSLDQSLLNEYHNQLSIVPDIRTELKTKAKQHLKFWKDLLLSPLQNLHDSNSPTSVKFINSFEMQPEWLTLLNTPLPGSGTSNIQENFQINGKDFVIDKKAIVDSRSSNIGIAGNGEEVLTGFHTLFEQ